MRNPQNIPAELKARNNWVVWKTEERDGRLTKPPYDANQNGKHVYAETDNAATWASFNRAAEMSDILLGSDYEGAGFVFTDTDYVGVDLDGVVHEDKMIDPFAVEIVKLANTYCEFSPSGTGVHLIFESSLPLPAGNRKGNKKLGGEIYNKTSPRYFTVTGDKTDLSTNDITKVEDPEKTALLHFMVLHLHDTKLTRLWMGDSTLWEGSKKKYPSQSEADGALCSMLAGMLNYDARKIEKYFSASRLGQRSKWSDRKDYRDKTIKLAIGDHRPADVSSNTSVVELGPAKIIVSRTASDIKPKRVAWLWKNKIALGKITTFAGHPDNGKSMVGSGIAAIGSTSRDFPDAKNTIPAFDVLMALGEDDLEDTAVPRLLAAGADLERIHFIESTITREGTTGEIQLNDECLEAEIKKWPNVRLLIIDPVSNYLGDVNMISEQAVRSVLIPLKNLAAKYGIAVIIVMHLNKKSDQDAISRVGGAMAFIGVSRSSWMFTRDIDEEGKPTDKFSMSRLKNNLVAASNGGMSYEIKTREVSFDDGGLPEFIPYVEWGGVIQKSADEALGARHDNPGRPKGTDFVQELLANGPQDSKELRKDAKEMYGLSERTLRRACDHLHATTTRGKDKDAKKYWVALPASDEPELDLTNTGGRNVQTKVEVR
jgi:putative DNA primase/helicase